MDIRSDEICLAAAVAVGVVGALFDLRPSHRIPNWLTYGAVVAGLTLRGGLGGWRELALAFAAVVVMFFFTNVLYKLGSMGGGDVKLMTSIAAFAAMHYVFYEMFCIAIAGGVIAIAYIGWKGQLRKRLASSLALVSYHFHSGFTKNPNLNLDSPDALKMPYGPAIALGSFAVLLISRGM
jgi:prepilin peptidase CpaA